MLVKEYRAKAIETAAKADLFYVLCIFKSPISGIERRVAYFEETGEAILFYQQLFKTYTALAYEFEITSNTSSCPYRTPDFFEQVELSKIEFTATLD